MIDILLASFVCLFASPSFPLVRYRHPIRLCRLTQCQYNENVDLRQKEQFASKINTMP